MYILDNWIVSNMEWELNVSIYGDGFLIQLYPLQ